MPSNDPKRRYADIVYFAKEIAADIDGLTLADFQNNRGVQRSVVYSLQCISEAAKKLSTQAEEDLPQFSWRGIRSFGNVSRHEYGEVDLKIVWQIALMEAPKLRAACEGLVESG